ncbi:uncharacterized protein LOC135135452 [Zophobas morio]|uniref:uncharacterized protein LOC135135452 n=1 Tax=Zophobas morio TaxID=2755281 RepID=UPI003083C186
MVQALVSEELRGRGRLFRNTYTKVVTVSQVTTSLIPSSCVRVEATLPPCRNVRYLKFPQLPTFSINRPTQVTTTNESAVETTPLGWGEYFGLYAPTVTVTTTDLHISTVQDPSVVVTFVVKGCRPLKLPMDLDRCPQEQPLSIEEALQTSTVSPVVNTAALLPTKTMSGLQPESTAVFNGLDLPEEPKVQENSNLLEPSMDEVRENGPVQPTETLVNT